MGHQAAGGPLRFPRRSWHHCTCFRAFAEPRLCHWASILRDVLQLYQPGSRTARSLEELEREQGLQERCLLAPEGARREGRNAPLACSWRRAHDINEGASRLHWRKRQWTLQALNLPLLSVALACLCMTSQGAGAHGLWGLR